MAISFMTDRAGIRSLGFLASAAAADFRQAAQRRKMRDVLRLQLAVERFCESKGPVPSRMPSTASPAWLRRRSEAQSFRR